jgi:HlyD family secretion protein
LPRLFLAQLEFKDRPEGSEAASEEGMRIAKTRRKHSRSYVLADYFRIGRNIIRKGDKVIQIVEQPDGRRLIDAPADVLYTRPWQGKGWGGQALASRDTAALNLNRTEVRASVNGFITNLNLATGTFASQRKPVMALIDSDSYRVEAYFEETKIPHIKPGATAKIRLMDGSPALLGTVVGIARGITDQDNKDGPELLSSNQSHVHVGPTGTAHSCRYPPHACTARRIHQCRNDLHSRYEGRRGVSHRGQYQESRDGNFLEHLRVSTMARAVKRRIRQSV